MVYEPQWLIAGSWITYSPKPQFNPRLKKDQRRVSPWYPLVIYRSYGNWLVHNSMIYHVFPCLTRVIFQFATDFFRRVSSFSPMISQWYCLLISVIFPLIIPSLTPNFTLPHPCGGCKRRSEKGSPGRSTLVDVSHWGDEFRMWLCRWIYPFKRLRWGRLHLLQESKFFARPQM